MQHSATPAAQHAAPLTQHSPSLEQQGTPAKQATQVSQSTQQKSPQLVQQAECVAVFLLEELLLMAKEVVVTNKTSANAE